MSMLHLFGMLMAYIWSQLPLVGLCMSLIFKEEMQAWWKGLRAKYVNNTYAGSIHWMKSHNFGTGEFVRVDYEKARGKGAGCHITYIDTNWKSCLSWSVYSQYEFQEVTPDVLDWCRKALAHNESCSLEDRIRVIDLLPEKIQEKLK